MPTCIIKKRELRFQFCIYLTHGDPKPRMVIGYLGDPSTFSWGSIVDSFYDLLQSLVYQTSAFHFKMCLSCFAYDWGKVSLSCHFKKFDFLRNCEDFDSRKKDKSLKFSFLGWGISIMIAESYWTLNMPNILYTISM